MRAVWLTIGFFALASGIAGIVLPLVPTTPFLLLAAFAFSRSSPSLHGWLVEHPRFGPPIAAWNAHGAISRRAKIAAGLAMLATFAISVVAEVATGILAVQAVVLTMVALFILTRPSPPDDRA
jgi:uncharacterized membrane protein YbaN (DUF454 family)